MFSETRYAMNGDLRVAYRTSPEGERDIVLVPAWFSNCEELPQQPVIQGWLEAMTSLGRLISSISQAPERLIPSRGARCRPWSYGPTASPQCSTISGVAKRSCRDDGALPTAALFAATHPSRTTALIVLEDYANPLAERTEGPTPEQIFAAMVAIWGTGEHLHATNPDMPWNEEIRAATARWERGAASPGTVARMLPLLAEMDVRALLPTVRVPTLVLHHSDDPLIPPEWGKDVADRIPGAKFVELPGATSFTSMSPTGVRRFRRLPDSSPASRPTWPMIGCWPRFCSPT